MCIFMIKHHIDKWHWDDKIRMHFYLSNYFENQDMSVQE